MVLSIQEFANLCDQVGAKGDRRLQDRSVKPTRGGLTEAGRVRLKRTVPALPASYLQLASTWALDDLELCFIQMRPGVAPPGASLVDDLEAAADPGVQPFHRVLIEHEALHVASAESDMICVSIRRHHIGSIWRIDPLYGRDLLHLGTNMYQFMTILCNLRALWDFSADDDHAHRAHVELDRRLRIMGVPETVRAGWAAEVKDLL